MTPQGGVLVRTEALLTALLFDHSLRIRLKAETETGADKASDGDADESSKSNLVGRINNLVTSDLDSIGEGREFLSLGALPRGGLMARELTLPSSDLGPRATCPCNVVSVCCSGVEVGACVPLLVDA